jgi:hypothetical protein
MAGFNLLNDIQREPAGYDRWLFFEPEFRLIVSVHEKEVFGFKVISTTLQEVEMSLRNLRQPAAVAVRIERRLPSAMHPEIEGGSRSGGVQHHFFVVAEQWNQLTLPVQGEELVQHSPTVDSSVNVVAQSDDRVVSLRLNQVEKRFESCRTAMNIADGDQSSALLQHQKVRLTAWQLDVRTSYGELPPFQLKLGDFHIRVSIFWSDFWSASSLMRLISFAGELRRQANVVRPSRNAGKNPTHSVRRR